MSDNENTKTTPDRELIESVWAEARDLIKRLEGSTVQRFAVAAGEYKIEIERGSHRRRRRRRAATGSTGAGGHVKPRSPPARAPV